MSATASLSLISRSAEESVLERLRRSARDRVSSASFSWLDLTLRELVAQGAEHQRRQLPLHLRRLAQVNMRSSATEYFVRSRVSRLLDTPVLRADAEEITLTLRPRVVARTEVNAALFFGRHELLRQLVERGLLRPEDIIKTWVARLDRRTRDSHVSLNGQVRPWGTAFVSPLTGVALQHPHDSSAPAGEVVNCRCSETVRILL